MAERGKGRYRVGIVGAGRQGTTQARAYYLNPDTEVVAAVDTDPQNLELFCKRFNCNGYSNAEEMYRKEKIDISAPILPVRANADAVVMAAKAKVKAINCEKPLTAMLSDADRMVKACRDNGVIFAAGLVPRNYVQHWGARDAINAGEIGEVHTINVYERNGQAGCHGINMALHFANDAEIDWLVGWVGSDPNSDGDPGDTSFVNKVTSAEQRGLGGIIRFKTGVMCHSHNGHTARSGIEVIGSKGIFFSDFYKDFRLYKLSGTELKEDTDRFPPQVRAVKADGTPKRDPDGWLPTTPGLRGTIIALVEALDTGNPPKLTTGHDLAKALEVCIAMRESHRRGFQPVTLPLADRSLKMFPVDARWNYKKDEMGAEWYMQQLEQYIRPVSA